MILNLTPLIDNLSKRKMVQRTEDTVNRRNKLITVSLHGQDLKKLIQPWIEELYTTAGRGVSMEDLQRGISLFEKMYYNLKA